MIHVRQHGNLQKTTRWMERCVQEPFDPLILEQYCREGVNALASATPRDTGTTANSWGYKINRTKGAITISFTNSNIQNGVPIAIILQYGHGTRNGGWVSGQDYINPAIKPIFDKIEKEAWKGVVKP